LVDGKKDNKKNKNNKKTQKIGETLFLMSVILWKQFHKIEMLFNRGTEHIQQQNNNKQQTEPRNQNERRNQSPNPSQIQRALANTSRT
jgi:hypothetical protein